MAPQVDPTQVEKTTPVERDWVLRALYASSSILAVFQVFWATMKLPIESKLVARSIPIDDAEQKVGEVLAARFGALSEEGKTVAARALVTKYFGETFIFITHILPAPLWSAIIPFQLHPASRSPGLKQVHHALGGTFFFLSSTMMVGFAEIMRKGLDIRPGREWFQGLQGKTLQEMPVALSSVESLSYPFLFGSAGWFSYTLYRSVTAAWRKRFSEHEEWVMRHVASGQWIGLMRIFLGKGFPFGFKTYGDTQEVLTNVFLGCGIGAWICCVSAAELAVSRVRVHRAAAKAARSAKPKSTDRS